MRARFRVELLTRRLVNPPVPVAGVPIDVCAIRCLKPRPLQIRKLLPHTLYWPVLLLAHQRKTSRYRSWITCCKRVRSWHVKAERAKFGLAVDARGWKAPTTAETPAVLIMTLPLAAAIRTSAAAVAAGRVRWDRFGSFPRKSVSVTSHGPLLLICHGLRPRRALRGGW
eukprot:4819042-Prymnesium_polylepis.2